MNWHVWKRVNGVQNFWEYTLNFSRYIPVADPRGCTQHAHPLKVLILSFWHILRNSRMGSWRRCNRKNVPPGKTYPPTVTVMTQHLKNISLSNLSFCRKILLNCLHILLKLQLWILFYKKVLADFKLYLQSSTCGQCLMPSQIYWVMKWL